MSDLFALLPKSRLLADLPGTSGPMSPIPKTGGGAGNMADEVFKTFKNVMGEVNTMQFNAEDKARAFAAGDVQDVHDVVLAINKAKFALDLTVRVRDKLLDAYRELSQMR